jgi:hypothetical protein
MVEMGPFLRTDSECMYKIAIGEIFKVIDDNLQDVYSHKQKKHIRIK